MTSPSLPGPPLPDWATNVPSRSRHRPDTAVGRHHGEASAGNRTDRTAPGNRRDIWWAIKPDPGIGPAVLELQDRAATRASGLAGALRRQPGRAGVHRARHRWRRCRGSSEQPGDPELGRDQPQRTSPAGPQGARPRCPAESRGQRRPVWAAPRCRSAAAESTRLRARRLDIGAWRAAQSVRANPAVTLGRVIPRGHRQRPAIPHHSAATPAPETAVNSTADTFQRPKMFLLSSSRQPATLTCRAERSGLSPLTSSII